jgi:hypothetical protein
LARYYFGIYEGTELVRDNEGSEFNSPEAALQGAARAAAEIGTSRLVKGDLRDVVIEVTDERHQRVFTVTASMKIERHTPLSLIPHP